MAADEMVQKAIVEDERVAEEVGEETAGEELVREAVMGDLRMLMLVDD